MAGAVRARLTMTANSYLERRRVRLALEELKRAIIFGMVISSMMLVVGCWRRLAVVGANDRLWGIIAIVGALGMILSVVLPSLWRRPEQVMASVLRSVGGLLFAALLACAYVLLVLPIGLLVQRTKGTDPIYAWERRPPARMEGWYSKQVVFEANFGRKRKAGMARRFFEVLNFFASRGHYLYLPTLVILLALGMVLFFVKSSALAPFIYTLF